MVRVFPETTNATCVQVLSGIAFGAVNVDWVEPAQISMKGLPVEPELRVKFIALLQSKVVWAISTMRVHWSQAPV